MKKKISVNVKKSPMKVLSFVLSSTMLVTSLGGVGFALANNSSAQSDGAKNSTQNLSPVIDPSSNEEMFVVNSTFYDYYSDSQVEGASGTTPGKINDGVYGTKDRATNNSFTKFNNMLYDTCNYGDTSLDRYPLYCGLFFGDQNSDVNGGFYYKNDSGSNIAKNFWLGANSSQKGGGTLGLHADVNAATQGLVDNKLTADGNITQANGAEILPYFNASYLTGTTFKGTKLPLGSVTENVSFPFRTVEKNGVETYEFDSKYDTVHLKENGTLEYLGYNKTYNKAVQVLDQKCDDGDGVKPGFFPYNTAGDSDSTRLNYGFGLKIEIPFNMTSDGKINGQDIVFNFSGDDDVWVFIDDELVLDIGGAHGEVTGNINFSEQYATVSGVKDNSAAFESRNYWYVTDKNIKRDVKSSFPSTLKTALKDTTVSHKLTMFYMERGKIESNMKINFNLPQPNKLTLTNTVKTDRVNEAFKKETTKQANKDIFNYTVNDSALEKNDSPLLKNGENTTYVDQFTTGDALNISEDKLTNEGRELKELYATSWDLNDPKQQISNSEDKDAYITSDDRAKKKDAFLFENLSDTASTNLTVNYYNEVLVGDLVVGKDVTDDAAYDNEKFTFQVAYSDVFGGNSGKEDYVGDYYVTYEDGTGETRNTKDGSIVLKAHEYATIVGVPVQTKYEVTEVLPEDSEYALKNIDKFDGEYDALTAAGTIVQGATANYFTFINEKKDPEATATPEPTAEPTVEPTVEPTEEPTPEPEVEPEDTVEPTEEPTAEPTVEPTVEPTEEPTPEPVVTEKPTAIPTVPPTASPKPTVVPTAAVTVSPKPIAPAAIDEAPAVVTAEPTVEPTVVPDDEVEVEEPEKEVPNTSVKKKKTPTPEPEVEEVVPEVPSSNPKTGDNTNIFFWILSVCLSAVAVVYTGRDLFNKKKEK